MIKRKILIFFIIAGLMFMDIKPAFSFWIWTPKSKKVINPRKTVKLTPEEQLEAILNLYNDKNLESALRECVNLIQAYPKAKEAAEAQYYLGRVYEDLGKPYEAYKNYQKVIDKYPFSGRLEEIIEREFKIAEKFLETKSNIIWQEIVGREYTPTEILRSVIKNAPYGKYAAISQYKIGVYLREISQFDAAVVELQKVIDEYPQSEWAEAARYQIALAQANRSLKPDYDQVTTKEALKEFEDFVQDHPELDLSKDAEEQITRLQEKEAENNFKIAAFYERQRQFKSAKIYYQHIVDNFPRSAWASQALERLEILERK